VLVTIDDLNALVELVKTHDGKSLSAKIEFSGGSIDTASDLRELTDVEMDRIAVKTDEIEIELSSEMAHCVGDESVSTLVYQRWARSRQLPGMGVRLGRMPLILRFFTLVNILIVPTAWIAYSTNPRNISLFTPIVITAAMVALTVVLGAGFAYQSNFATIRPITLDEYRKEQTGAKRQLITWLIAVSALAVSAIGVLIAVLVKK
jgi:hypothetical protein